MKEERFKSRELRNGRDSGKTAKFSQFLREIKDMNKQLSSRDRKDFLNNKGRKHGFEAKIPMATERRVVMVVERRRDKFREIDERIKKFMVAINLFKPGK